MIELAALCGDILLALGIAVVAAAAAVAVGAVLFGIRD